MSILIKKISLLFFLCILDSIICSEENVFFMIDAPNYRPGFFSVFLSVLGALKEYEKGVWSGLSINFTKGLYRDPSRDDNWWEYYFEPIFLGNSRDVTVNTLSDEEMSKFAMCSLFDMNRNEGNRLINAYIKVKTHVQKKVNEFVQNNFQNYFIIGIHYRGTDKATEAERISYEEFYNATVFLIQNNKNKPYKIFIATDEQDFVDYMKTKFNMIIYRDILRSSDGKPLHIMHPNPYISGEDSIIDCLLLAKCHAMVRGRSNLSNIVSKFNPDMDIVHLGKSSVEISGDIVESY